MIKCVVDGEVIEIKPENRLIELWQTFPRIISWSEFWELEKELTDNERAQLRLAIRIEGLKGE